MQQNDASDIERLFQALPQPGRVEVQRHFGHPSGSLATARASSRYAAEANARGERIARVIDQDGVRQFECGVSGGEAGRLVAAGAIEV